MMFDKDDLQLLREFKKESKKYRLKKFKNSSDILQSMGLKPYYGKGGNWFNIYYKDNKYFYSPKTGKFKKRGENWYKLGGFSSLVNYFKRDELCDVAQDIIDEVNDLFNMRKRMNKDLICLLALGRDKEWILSNAERCFHRYGKFDWYWFDERVNSSF